MRAERRSWMALGFVLALAVAAGWSGPVAGAVMEGTGVGSIPPIGELLTELTQEARCRISSCNGVEPGAVLETWNTITVLPGQLFSVSWAKEVEIYTPCASCQPVTAPCPSCPREGGRMCWCAFDFWTLEIEGEETVNPKVWTSSVISKDAKAVAWYRCQPLGDRDDIDPCGPPALPCTSACPCELIVHYVKLDDPTTSKREFPVQTKLANYEVKVTADSDWNGMPFLYWLVGSEQEKNPTITVRVYPGNIVILAVYGP